ncbi:hypothetical protein ABE85_08290 [Mitsuaria sp. 7]|nr:hypothetical protein ABE85_08290 [Mitsuaria sp. 7]
MSLHLPPQPGQALAEVQQQAELVLAAQGHPVRVIAVLLAAAGVTRGGLDMAIVTRADPDVLVGRRDRQGADALERRCIAHRPPRRIDITEALGCALAAQPGFAIGHPTQ